MTATASLPAGWTIVTTEPRKMYGDERFVRILVREGDDVALTVEVSKFEKFGGMAPAEVSWPSTSDKRPALAIALSAALLVAADVARDLDN